MLGLFKNFQITDDNYIYIILIIAGIAIIAMVSYYFNNKNRILRRLKKVDPKRIQLIKENEYAKVIGKARLIDKPLISPIGKRECVYYQIKVEEKRSNGKSSSWHTVIKEEKSINFIIESSGEKAIVKSDTSPKTKMIHIVKDVEHRSGTWNDPPKFLENYLKLHGKNSTGFLGFNKTIRYHEGVIEIGEEITVSGIGKWEETDHNFDRYSSKSLFISGDNTNKLIITDDPKAVESKKSRNL